MSVVEALEPDAKSLLQRAALCESWVDLPPSMLLKVVDAATTKFDEEAKEADEGDKADKVEKHEKRKKKGKQDEEEKETAQQEKEKNKKEEEGG